MVGMPDTDQNVVQRNPVVVICGGVVVVVQAVVALIMAFGVDLTGQQVAGIMFVTTAVLALVVAIITRGKVYPKAELDQLALQAAEKPGVPAPVPPTGSDAAKVVLEQLAA